MPRKSPFLFLSLLSLSLYPISFPPLLFSFPLPHFPFLIHKTYFSFCLFPHLIFSFSHFLIFSFSHFLIFSFLISHFSFISLIFHFFHFLLYLFFFLFFLFSFLFPIWIASTEWSKSKRNFPPLSSIATCHSHIFFPYFHDFYFPMISSFDIWLNVSHSHKCTT